MSVALYGVFIMVGLLIGSQTVGIVLFIFIAVLLTLVVQFGTWHVEVPAERFVGERFLIPGSGFVIGRFCARDIIRIDVRFFP